MPPTAAPAGGRVGLSFSSVPPPAWGNATRTVVPLPSRDSISTWPPLCSAMPYTVESPSPVPSPGPLVVKKGSNARARTSSLMPVPLSVTVRYA
ncbi:hypothetical protein Gocc_1427 [Gaiella occulta]|uniref:Uncharacterized protein n=1 Tax=Gaiella occulta TaxID=1002870 RepID=A0A7M2YYI8_9ACTN|nr:hypothetical protein [Gaiella occulta]RDI74538.1 hypothetical protein Gocc_1427 [Gaiella occulta]